MWLKRWTPQNIVIGGAAGAFPPMIGWAVATGGVSVESVLMFTLIFMWTPPHFWALCLFMKADYEDAGVPMLTVTHGRKSTRKHILVYTLLLAPIAIGAGFTSIGGPIYLSVAVILNALFVKGAIRHLETRRGDGRGGSIPHRERRCSNFRSIISLAFHRDPAAGDTGRLRVGGW